MLEAYRMQKALVADLQARLARIQLDSEEAFRQAEDMEAQVRALQLVNASLQRDQQMLQAALDERAKLQEAEIKRLKKSRWKWLLAGAAGGCIIGVVIGLTGGQ